MWSNQPIELSQIQSRKTLARRDWRKMSETDGIRQGLKKPKYAQKGRVWKPQTVPPYPIPKSVQEMFRGSWNSNTGLKDGIIGVIIRQIV